MEKTFSIRECFSVGWARFRSRAWFLVGVSLFMWGVAFLSAVLIEEVYGHIEPTRSVLDFLSQVVYYWLTFGLIAISLKLIDSQDVMWADLFIFDRRFFFYLLGTILYGFVVGVGFVLLIIPGIYLALRYGFFWYAMVDGKKGVFDAFHESARITQGVKWQLILFCLASVGVMLLGFLVLGVGVLVATPVIMLASAHLYRVLLSQTPESAMSTDTPLTPPRPEDKVTDANVAAAETPTTPTIVAPAAVSKDGSTTEETTLVK
jgi:hypothetical protein